MVGHTAAAYQPDRPPQLSVKEPIYGQLPKANHRVTRLFELCAQRRQPSFYGQLPAV